MLDFHFFFFLKMIYNVIMKTNNIVRAFFGMAVLLAGGIILAQNLGVIDEKLNIWKFFWGGLWSAAFLAAGISTLLRRRHLIWGVFLIAIGTSFVLNVFDVVDVNTWKVFWPAILIFVGGSILFDKSFSKKSDEKSVADSNISAVFYGENSKINGDYNGGQITAAFGGVELDLSGAKIKDGSEIEVFALCGGIEISLPSDVIVENRVRGILGGSEDKTRPDSSAKKKLIVKGDCVLGGLEIR